MRKLFGEQSQRFLYESKFTAPNSIRAWPEQCIRAQRWLQKMFATWSNTFAFRLFVNQSSQLCLFCEVKWDSSREFLVTASSVPSHSLSENSQSVSIYSISSKNGDFTASPSGNIVCHFNLVRHHQKFKFLKSSATQRKRIEMLPSHPLP